MKVGVLGSGDVAKALGAGFVSRGHDVMLGSRSPEKLAGWVAEQEGASAATFAEAAEHGRMVVFAVRGDAAESVAESVGGAAFSGKIVIDATNPLASEGDGPPGLFVGTDDSLGERLQRALPKARVVKCFNTISNAKLVDPSFAGGVPEMLVCGNDADAKAEVGRVVASFGWPGTLDAGGIEAARWLEALVPLWVRVGAVLGTWGHAFRVVRN